jgi:hypothetical protein
MPSTPKLSLKAVRQSLEPAPANAYISNLITNDAPCLVARFGSIELGIVRRYHKQKNLSSPHKLIDFLTTGTWSYSWWGNDLRQLEINAGFYPITPANLDRFAQLMIASMAQVDLLGSWVPGEAIFAAELAQAQVCDLADLEPYYHPNPWSQHLADRRVLVVHPFAESIHRQYHDHRAELFADPLVLPQFDLVTLPAVQSIAGNRPAEYPDWFAALDSMFDRAVALKAEVVIIGCGAYGFPLGARLKAAGHQVIHLGGCTQILFGIKGKRWDNNPAIAKFYNDAWVRPAASEQPRGAQQVDRGCYW